MKKIATWVFATVGAIVLLFMYKTSTGAQAPVAAPQADASTGATSSAPAAPSPSPSPGLKDGTYTGVSEDTPYGPVQVQITVTAGQVATGTAVTFPSGTAKAQQVNAMAVPVLQGETPGTKDGQLAMVTGATFTSNAYIGSLQEALDQAHP